MPAPLQAVRGMNDVLPDEAAIWEFLEDTARDVFRQYGYRNIRMPVVEPTPLFVRAIGEVTDVVERECGDVEKAWGPNAEVYRCENCKALYLPTPGESKINVAGTGMISVFGLTLPPKEK